MSTPMLPNHIRGIAYALSAPYDTLLASVSSRIAADRLITGPLRLLAWGTDASFYRLVPKLAVVVESEEEMIFLLTECARLQTPVTFRAAGTSLLGQAITDSVLLLLGDQWRRCEVSADAATITLQPGVIGAEANRRLARYGRKIGPDPASIDTAMIGGIAANNSSGSAADRRRTATTPSRESASFSQTVQSSTRAIRRVGSHSSSGGAIWRKGWADPVLKQPFLVKDGQIEIPNRPGAGIEWQEAAVERYLYKT